MNYSWCSSILELYHGMVAFAILFLLKLTDILKNSFKLIHAKNAFNLILF